MELRVEKFHVEMVLDPTYLRPPGGRASPSDKLLCPKTAFVRVGETEILHAASCGAFLRHFPRYLHSLVALWLIQLINFNADEHYCINYNNMGSINTREEVMAADQVPGAVFLDVRGEDEVKTESLQARPFKQAKCSLDDCSELESKAETLMPDKNGEIRYEKEERRCQ